MIVNVIISKFERESNRLALILSPRAAGVGLNLVMANHVVHFGRWWNPAIENQATDRVYRIGQQRPVHVYHLILSDQFNPTSPVRSFDEALAELIESKQNLADDFLTLTNDDFMKELSSRLLS